MQALRELLLLGAIDKKQRVTELGKKMATLPLEPPLSKLLLESSRFECGEEALTVVAMMAVDSFFYTPPGKKEEAAQARSIFEHADGDHFTYLKIYRGWELAQGSKEWCTQHFINSRNMKKVADIRLQLLGYCAQVQLQMQSCSAELTNLARCLCTAFYANAATMAPDGRHYKVESSALEARKREHILERENTFCKERTHSVKRAHVLYRGNRLYTQENIFYSRENPFCIEKTHSTHTTCIGV